MSGFIEACLEVPGDVARWFGILSDDDGKQDEVERDVDELLDEIEPLVARILAEYSFHELREDTRRLLEVFQSFAGISREVTVLLSTLITAAERFGERRGKEKREFVIEAALELYRRHDIDLPKIPRFLEETVLRWLLGAMIDYTVDLFNVNFGREWVKRHPESDERRMDKPPIEERIQHVAKAANVHVDVESLSAAG